MRPRSAGWLTPKKGIPLNPLTRITSLAFASALAWTATAADPAGSPSQTSSPSSTSPAAPSAAADSPSASPAGAQAAAKAEKPPPSPLHEIEGNGGIFSTLSAYLVNPPRNGEPVGRPSIGFGYINMGYGRDLVALTVTETPWKRLELGFGYDLLNLGDLPTQIAAQPNGPHISDNLALYNANARLQILQENEFGQKWLPAITAGIHYKYNDGISRINSQLGGALDAIGLSNNEGLDFTLYGSKMLTFLPRPVLVNLGGRATKSAEIGLLGFTDQYSFVLEASVVVLVTDRFMLAAEYKMQPRGFTPVPGLIGAPDDWWTIDAGYVINPHMTVAVGYGHFGTVANHEANSVFGVTVKYEF
jgi:hypothetical protein